MVHPDLAQPGCRHRACWSRVGQVMPRDGHRVAGVHAIGSMFSIEQHHHFARRSRTARLELLREHAPLDEDSRVPGLRDAKAARRSVLACGPANPAAHVKLGRITTGSRVPCRGRTSPSAAHGARGPSRRPRAFLEPLPSSPRGWPRCRADQSRCTSRARGLGSRPPLTRLPAERGPGVRAAAITLATKSTVIARCSVVANSGSSDRGRVGVDQATPGPPPQHPVGLVPD